VQLHGGSQRPRGYFSRPFPLTSILPGASGTLEARRRSQAGCPTSGSRVKTETEKFRCRRRIAPIVDLASE
jgi:hypothetical protein